MSQSLLLLISGDPRADHRPAEALRIAAGIVPWGRVRVSVYLHGPAVSLLADDSDWLEGGPSIHEALGVLERHHAGVGVEPNGMLRELARNGRQRHEATPVDPRTLNRWIESHDSVCRF